MDMPFGIFAIYSMLKLPEFLTYDWSTFSCLKPLVTKLDVLYGSRPFVKVFGLPTNLFLEAPTRSFKKRNLSKKVLILFGTTDTDI